MNEESQIQRTVTNRGIQLRTVQDFKDMAEVVIKSQLAPKGFDTPAKVFLALQAGMELELSPMQALQGLTVINGKIGIMGDTALALVKNSGQLEYIKEEITGENENMVAHCETKRKDQKHSVITTFSVEDAKKAGLWNKPGSWQQYPKRMLRYRALGFNLRDNFPDTLKGLHLAEEYEGVQMAEITMEQEPRTAELLKEPEEGEVIDEPEGPQEQMGLDMTGGKI